MEATSSYGQAVINLLSSMLCYSTHNFFIQIDIELLNTFSQPANISELSLQSLRVLIDMSTRELQF